MIDLLKIALEQYAISEIEGNKHNQQIINYSKEIGFPEIKDDETAWCSIFINWCALKSGYERTKKLNAKSWLNIGIKIENPELGDIVIFDRGGWKGHVAIFIVERNNLIYALGGNQSNMVKISHYKKNKVLGYRKLNKILT